MAYRMKMTAAEKAEQAKQNQRQRNQNRDDFRKLRDENEAAAKARREKTEAQQRARREQMGYGRASIQMAREVANNEKPGMEGRFNRLADRATDEIGDLIRSGASAIGIENDFDTGRMKARKEIKGYKKGGKVKAKKYNKGGKVRGCGMARRKRG